MKKLQKITLSDGYVFFEQLDGSYTDTKNKNDETRDLSFDNYKQIKKLDKDGFIEIVKTEIYN